MIIERTSDEVIIRLPSSMDTKELQLLIDYINYKQLTEESNTLKEVTDPERNNSKENELHYEMSNSSFANAWAENEPEYSLDDIKIANPDYEGR